MIDSTNPRILADNIRDLTDKQIADAAEIVALQGDIEALGTYSTDEVDTGMKLGNKPIYRKVFEVESMPNNTSVQIPHGIENLETCINIYGVMQITSGQAGEPIPYGNSVLVRFNWTVIVLQTNSDYSANPGIIVIEYTKLDPPPSPDLAPAPDDTRSIEPEAREDEPIIDEPIEEPVAEVKKTTTRKKSTN